MRLGKYKRSHHVGVSSSSKQGGECAVGMSNDDDLAQAQRAYKCS
jgi:hypothetical protein